MGMMINRRRVMGGGEKGLPAGAIDMGLPSGTLWAQGNIVKDANGNYAIGEPTDYGCYFSWGNIDGHNEGEGYSFSEANYALTPGSKVKGDISSDDAEHDAAVARIGGGFHMLSGAQIIELFNSEYTTNEWTTLNGVNGRRVTSKANGNSIFLPATGLYNGTSLNNRSYNGSYWLLNLYSASYANCLYFNSNNLRKMATYNRYYGFPVRAVFNG